MLDVEEARSQYDELRRQAPVATTPLSSLHAA
jgi:hypothetical protein